MAALMPSGSNSETLEQQDALSTNLQTLTLVGGNLAAVGQEKSRKNAFLKPLSFPEPKTKDLSHFVDSNKDIPIVCIIPTCTEVFVAQPKANSTGQSTDPCEEVGSSGTETDRGAKGAEADVSKLQFSPKDNWLRHLLLSHKIVIDKVAEISSLRR